MTLNAAINTIYRTLLNSETSYISVEEVILKNSLIEEDQKNLKDLIAAGLKKLEDLSVIVKINDKTWVLIKPLNQINQTIEIPYDFATLLVKELNTFLEKTDNANLAACVGDIQQQHLNAICLALGVLNKELDKQITSGQD